MTSVVCSQINRETRAVWIATNFRLDWPPPTLDQSQQKSTLIEIFDNIERKNLNTIYFQVRFNGTVLFNSSFEPCSFYLTNEVGGIPGYDPLQFAIDEAHKRGLEIHAWVNMVRCFNGSEQIILDYPQHITNLHPNWIHKVREGNNTSLWVDPGLPEVRQYLTTLVLEIVEKYEVDGIQLDFIRYPVNTFDDSFAYSVYGNGIDINEWRRNNITGVVKSIKRGIDQIDPQIKFGVTPIGIYENINGARGLQSFSEIHQDTRLWLREKYIDYAVPQVYWDFENNPRFDLLVNDWAQNSYERNVIIGIASYKDEVHLQTERMIEFVRSKNLAGTAFFRYAFIKDDFYKSYSYKSLPALMPWKDNEPPLSPVNLQAKLLDEKDNKIQLTWMLPELMLGAEDVKYYALFNLENQYEVLTSKNLMKIISADKASVSFSINMPDKVYYYFAVKSLDRFWNESYNSTNVVEYKIPVLASIVENAGLIDNAVLTKIDNNNYSIIITSTVKQNVEIKFINKDGVVITATKFVQPGINIFEIEENFISIEVVFSDSKKMKLSL